MSELPTNNSSQDEIADWQSVANIMHTWHPDLQAHVERIIGERNLPIDLSTHEVQSGHDVNVGQFEQASEKIILGGDEIRPRHIDTGETEIVLQRHGKYIRDKDDPNAGKLTPEAIQLEKDSATRYFSELIAQVPESERGTINVLFVSSDTSFAGNGQRSYQTTEIAQQVAEQLFQENGINLLSVLNISPNSKNLGSPVAMRTLREPQMIDKSPDFFSFMREKYGDLGIDFWVAFEEDKERETRLEMGAEGPDEIADRMNAALRILSKYSKMFHAQNPNNRLIIWAGTHYDTISPFVKRDVLHKEKTETVLVDYGGGVVVDLGTTQNATVMIADSKHAIKL